MFSFGSDAVLQKRVAIGVCDFLEVFAGLAALSNGARRQGLVVAPGIDRCRETYGRHWDLRGSRDQVVLACLIVEMLQPLVIHLGIVCTQMCVIGNQQVDPEGLAMTEFSLDIADHQVLRGLHASWVACLVGKPGWQ